MLRIIAAILFCASLYATEGMRIRAEFPVNGVDGKTEVHTVHGTCCAVQAHIVVTALHNVTKGTLAVETMDGWKKAKLVSSNERFDIAFLRVEGSKLEPIQLQTTDAVVVAGSDHGAEIKLKASDCTHIRVLTLSGMQLGVSGAPVISTKGKLVGVIVSLLGSSEDKSGTYTEALAVSADIIADLLEDVK